MFIHNYLRVKNKAYYKWHTFKFATITHYCILAIYIFGLPFSYISLNKAPSQTKAAGSLFTEDFSTISKIDLDRTTAKLILSAKKATLPYAEEPTQSAGLNNLPQGMTGQAAAFVTNSSSSNNHKTYIFTSTAIYKYDPDQTNGRLLTTAASLPGNVWPDRAFYYPSTDKIYVFISVPNGPLYNTSVYEFDVVSEEIKQVKGLTSDPESTTIDRFGFSYAYDSSQTVYMANDEVNHFGDICFQAERQCPSGAIYTFNPNSTPKINRIKDGAYSGRNDDLFAISSGDMIYQQSGNDKYLYLLGGSTYKTWTTVDTGSGLTDVPTDWKYTTDIVRYDINSLTSSKPFPTGTIDQSQIDFYTIQTSPTQYYIYGGTSYNGTSFPIGGWPPQKIFSFNISTGQYAESPDGDWSDNPGSYVGIAASYNSYKHQVYVINPSNIWQSGIDNYTSFTNIPNGTSYFTNHNIQAAYAQSAVAGYVFGGSTNKIDKYDFTSGTVTAVKTDLTGAISNYQIALTTNDGTILLLGGEGHTSSIYKYNPTANTLAEWGTNALSPFVIRANYTAAVYDSATNTVYIAVNNSGTVQIFSFVVNSDPSPVLSSPITLSGLTDTITQLVLKNNKLYLHAHQPNKSYNTAYPVYVTDLTDENHTFSIIGNSTYLSRDYKDIFTFIGDNLYIYQADNAKLYDVGTQSTLFQNKREIFSMPSTTGGNLASFIKNDGTVLQFNTSGALQRFNPLYQHSAEIRSQNINSGNATIYQATLTSTQTIPQGTSVAYQMSANGGTDWKNAIPGQAVEFGSASGSDLRWKAVLTGSDVNTPEISRLDITYHGVSTAISIGSAGAVKGAGEPTDSISLSIIDDASRLTVANSDTVITLSSNSDLARFAASQQGPWLQTLSLNVAKDAEPPSFFYLNYEPGVHTITASTSPTLKSDTLAISTGPGIYTASINYSKRNLPVSDSSAPNPSSISVRLTGLNGASVENKSITIFSSNSRDIIDQPKSTTDDTGLTFGSIYSKYPGQRTISIQILPDNVWLETSNKLTFLHGPVETIVNSTQVPTLVNPENPINLDLTLQDHFGNLATSASGILTFASTDKRAILPMSYRFNSSDQGHHSFPGIYLRTIHSQTITLSYLEDGMTSPVMLRISPIVSPSSVSAIASTIESNPNSIKADGKDMATIIVTLKDTFGNPVEDKQVSLKSSRKQDSISSVAASLNAVSSIPHSNPDGQAIFNLTSEAPGDSKLTAYDVTDNLTIDRNLHITVEKAGLAAAIVSTLDPFISNSVVKKVIKNVLKPVSQAAAAAGVLTILVQGVATLPSIFQFFVYLFALIGEALGIKRRPKNWGVVFDSISGKPVDLAVIRLFNYDTKALIATRVSDLNGRFGFSVSPGNYFVSVAKPGYIFPVTKNSLANVAKWQSYYVGSPLKIDHGMSNLSLTIPIEPVETKLSIFSKFKVITRAISNWITAHFVYVLLPFLVLGVVVYGLTAYVTKEFKYYIILDIYIAMIGFYTLLTIKSALQHGVVLAPVGKKSAQKFQHLKNAIVYLFDAEFETLRSEAKTDRDGRFTFFVPKGKYYLTVKSDDYKMPQDKNTVDKNLPHLSKFYEGGIIDIKRPGYINAIVRMKKA